MSNKAEFKDAAEELRAHGKELKEEFGRLGHSAKDAAYEQVEQRTRQIKEVIQEQPLRSVLIAAGVGFVLGALWARD